MTEDRIDTIEQTLAHQERQINDLSDMVISQSGEIAALKKQILKMQSQVENIENEGDSGSSIPANEKPPHY